MKRLSSLTLAVVIVSIALFGFTEWRLWQGVDLADESYYVAIPFNYSHGAKPFVDEVGMLQLPGVLVYPLFKPFVAIQHGHGDGIIIYGRHLYLLLMLCVAAAVAFALRRLVRWQYAALIALLYVSFVLIERPQLSYNTMGAAFLTLTAAFGLQALLAGRQRATATGSPRRPRAGWLIAAGVATGLAGFAFPTLWVMLPVCAVCLALALRLFGSIDGCAGAGGLTETSDAGNTPAAAIARALGCYGLGAGVVLAAEAGLMLWAGLSNVMASLDSSLVTAQEFDQVGGWPKFLQVLESLLTFFWTGRVFLVAALLLYLVLRRQPALGRTLLILLPLPLYWSGETIARASGWAIALSFIAPYLYLFLPAEHRRAGRLLLLWVTAPSFIAAIVTAWTSADGYTHASVGAYPGFMASAVMLVWAVTAGCRELSSPARDGSWRRLVRPGIAVFTLLVAMAAVTVVFQFQFITRQVPYSQLTAWVDRGPYWGVHTTPARKQYLESLDRDLARLDTGPRRLLVSSGFPGGYLFWPYQSASNAVWTSPDDRDALPAYLTDWMRTYHVVPGLVLLTTRPDGMPDREYVSRYGLGLGYRLAVRRAQYALLTRPARWTPAFLGTTLSSRAGD
jgi:hypothetical protein